ncbi:AraC family transcriptional regulator [Enterococcus sp. SMC-9]|uniref:AraC family transcriptional regulator n=1 Tax=Enterococcus sp. SMC-9 TaxID=2862343 RepID=UPI001E2BEC57|nr:AraC family transcriptional regulator [Enterococcus sp. SMC-9]MCD1025577.1 AraC family transcriptional regulator [Enterococcus sp. SMC-9]
MNYFVFNIPPFPYFEESNKAIYFSGTKHIDRRNFEFFDFIFVTKGCLYLTEENRSYEINANQGLILTPYLHHFSHKPVEKQTDFYWVHFQTTSKWNSISQLTRGEQKQLILPQFFSISHPEVVIQNFEKLNDLQQAMTDEQVLERESLLLQLLKIITTNTTDDLSVNISEVAKQTVLSINSHFKERLEIQDIAHKLNFHPTYISRCMKKVYGVSAKQYLQELRMNHAQSLLKSTNYSIEEIAHKSGFNSLSFFSKSFTKKQGLSPTNFRNHYRKVQS